MGDGRLVVIETFDGIFHYCPNIYQRQSNLPTFSSPPTLGTTIHPPFKFAASAILSDFQFYHQKPEKMMHMTFYWGKKVTLLFDSWKTDSWLSYGLTLLACFLFSVFYQYMEDRRIRFKIIAKSKPSPSGIDTPLLFSRISVGRWSNPVRFGTSVLFGVNSAIGYVLMLAIMSFNGGVFIAIVLGLAFGYLLFRSNDEEVVVLENPCACA